MKKNKIKLTIELIPSNSWYDNVRSNVSKERWDEIRFECYRKAKYICEICGDKGKNQGYDHDVECHEIWDFDDNNHIQKLVGFISLCPLCHKTKHIGLAQINGEEELVLNQLMKVNNFTKTQASNYICDSFKIWQERSQYYWTIDFSYVENYKNQLSQLLGNFNKFRKS